MSEVITRAINVDTNITAEYVAASSSVAGSFLFGIAFEKDIAYDLSFSSLVDLGDFATLSVINSGLSIGGSFRLANEFGKDCHVSRVILAPDETESLKTLLTSSDEDCASGELLSFDILYTESGVEKKKTNIILHCTDGHTARKDNMQTAINAAFDTGEIPSVSLVGETSIVIAFSPLVSKVEIVVPEAYNGNKYGMLNDTVTKSSATPPQHSA
eukprot:scaffold5843_cov136-Alexandrium_tamarense.AAC.1